MGVVVLSFTPHDRVKSHSDDDASYYAVLFNKAQSLCNWEVEVHNMPKKAREKTGRVKKPIKMRWPKKLK